MTRNKEVQLKIVIYDNTKSSLIYIWYVKECKKNFVMCHVSKTLE